MHIRPRRLTASASNLSDASPGGIIATSMRYLVSAAPTASGMTIISPDGIVRYISREEAERFVLGPADGEIAQ